ncbi:MAG TPA: HAMP domain-containing sensor histidine kinase, partial [Leptolinea sp.]
MLNHLRLRLTLLYLLAAVILVGIVGASSYSLINYYFTESNDAALRYKMAQSFASIGIKLPADLETSVLEWEGHDENKEVEINNGNTAAIDEENNEALGTLANGLAYEGELASIFIFPLDSQGKLIFNPNPFTPPMDPDANAAVAAIKNGMDIRTTTLKDGSPIRLLSYATPEKSGFSVLQLGKPISDQVHLLNQFLTGLAVSGILIVLVVGIGSWWVAGRSLRPTQKAWEMQQTFIANASHELRTPLTLIRASSEVAFRQTRPTEKQKSLLQDIMCECDHMSELVEDLLLISKLDTHQLKLDLKAISMKDLLEDVQRQFTPLAEKQNVSLLLNEQQGIVMGDRMRLRQVFLILLDNALRYTPRGGTIKLSATQSNRSVTVSVCDNGSGISLIHLEHVFERFYQADTGLKSEEK